MAHATGLARHHVAQSADLGGGSVTVCAVVQGVKGFACECTSPRWTSRYGKDLRQVARRKSRSPTRQRRVFYAYPANPESTGETIGNAIGALNQESRVRKDRIRFRKWVDLPNAGKNLVASILREIDRSDVFACDLTYPNPNVAFELGYSIAKFKRVWISLDRGVADAEKNYKRLYFGLIGATYAPYINSEELTAAFLSHYPTSSLDDTILGDHYRNSQLRLEVPTLLYCKLPIATESVIGCVRSLEDSVFDRIVDDPARKHLSYVGMVHSKHRSSRCSAGSFVI